MDRINVAIDGPAGAGKSTVAKLVARKLGFLYIDTGAMYRALTLKAIELQMNLNHQEELRSYIDQHSIRLSNHDGIQTVWVDDEDVTERIRSQEVSRNVSLVSSHPLVREKMVQLQQDLAKDCNVVMDGRDIGTHVLPDAKIKIFLTASIEERANRRYKELLAKGEEANLTQIEQEIALRDKKDQERAIAPLKKAGDAILLDTSHMNIEQVVEQILLHVQERMGGK